MEQYDTYYNGSSHNNSHHVVVFIQMGDVGTAAFGLVSAVIFPLAKILMKLKPKQGVNRGIEGNMWKFVGKFMFSSKNREAYNYVHTPT